ncbi:Uu.00g104900.m01.CDS01 [Anthostomella pinea]|uniref:Uu.00g104900.m01.CDS01 n=1 Tax=Anthostomella pinea TaxID=933095 RepID=A0AAI8VDP5_9PEZI|nr:Uu.00g104900.m01.CDS01 [Anthostomella pinea]
MSPTPHYHDLKSSEAVLGIDFGNGSSKESLVRSREDREPYLIRVPFKGGLDDPRRAGAVHQFTAYAAQDKAGKLVVGKEALRMDFDSPQDNPDLAGRDHPCQAGLLEHFKLLYDSAIAAAAGQKVTIRSVVLTYPNYLCPSNYHSGSFETYLDTYIGLMRSIWADDMHIETASEGQAAAIYICEPYHDVYGTDSQEERHRTLFADLDKQKGLNLLVVDTGASTLNVQCMTVYFDEKGDICNSQSNVPSGWVTGTRGGSHISNDKIRTLVEQELKPLLVTNQLAEGEMAHLLQDFEGQKKHFNYVENTNMMNLRGYSQESFVPLSPEQVRHAFESAFRDGLDLLKRHLHRLVGFQGDFAVLFCGGSYCNPGLYHQVKSIMADFEITAAARSCGVKHAFMRDEPYWSSAVSSGVALSLIRMPPPGELLRSSCIGPQEVSYKRRNGKWGKKASSTDAHVVYCYELDRTLHVEIEVPGRNMKLVLNMVCDPLWVADVSDSHPFIEIGRAEEVIGGPISTYDLAFEVSTRDLPRGPVYFTVDHTKVRDDGPVSLQLECYTHLKRGAYLPNDVDRKWTIPLRTDRATKLLQVGKAVQLPIWCKRCSKKIGKHARVCQDCDRYSVCTACYVKISTDWTLHPKHVFTGLSAYR